MIKIIRITTISSSLNILLKGQLEYLSRFYEIIGISSPGKELKIIEKREGIRTVSVKMTRTINPFRDLLSLLILTWIIKKEKPYIVHTHTPKAGTLGMIASWINRVPVRMHTVAGLPLMETNGIKRMLLHTVEKITYACATNIYPNSFGLKDYILNQNLCSSSKIKVIANGSSNGIDTTFFSPNHFTNETKLEFRKKFNIARNDLVFIFIGRLVKDKGINELVNAFSRLNIIHPHLKLFLVGETENKLDPLSSETKIKISSNQSIIVTGFQEDIRPFLSISDVLVFPSYREGFPNVPMQAGSMGKPAIVTDINGCNEIIKNGINGENIPSKNEVLLYEKMKEWVDNPDKLSEFARNSRRMIKSRYEQRIIWDELLKEYNSLIKK